jgi:hypothetical protein
MVVQSINFNNGVTAMGFTKNWYFERDSKKDYSGQWRPPTDWLDFLKTTVVAGKAWDRDVVQSSNPGTLVSSQSNMYVQHIGRSSRSSVLGERHQPFLVDISR